MDKQKGIELYQSAIARLKEIEKEIARVQPRRNQPYDVALHNRLNRQRSNAICKLNQIRIRYWLLMSDRPSFPTNQNP